ncbi:replication-relaxation family protein [Streptomyces sp. NPDC060027]|uniref:replication-relaxation family protein n=1 Tax=Streptomyces sp. NPDC060027 TaxID=3347040 RepID=UPI00368DF50C
MTTTPPPARPAPPPFTPSPLEPLPHQLLAALAQHRMATTGQLRLLLRPHATRQAISQPLNRLRTHGLINYTVLPRSNRTRAWYLTPDGARLTRNWPALRGRPPYPITSTTAASLKTPHTLTAVRAHLTFVRDARRRGDEHGHLDWTPEVTHPLSERERVIADAVMHYTLNHDQQRRKLRAFIEIDRATMSSERLAAKLIDYARLWSHPSQPANHRRPRQHTETDAAWLRWYPVYPRILFILTGASPTTLANRINDLRDMTTQHPLVAALARNVPLGAATLNDLETAGPSQNVWVCLAGAPDRQPWHALHPGFTYAKTT